MPDGRIIGGGLVVVGVCLALGAFIERDTDDTSTIDQKISQVELQTGSGDVRIETGDVPTTKVEEHREFLLFNTGKAHRVEDGGKLVLDSDCGWRCEATWIVTVPKGTKVTGKSASGNVVLDGVGDVDVRAASGDVTVTDATGSVRVDVASGNTTVDGAVGGIDLTAKSGDITATGLSGGGEIKADAASGDIELTLQEPASVTADAASGDVVVHVPSGANATYKVDTETKSGEATVRIPTDPAGTNVLTLRTKSGDVEVTGAD